MWVLMSTTLLSALKAKSSAAIRHRNEKISNLLLNQ